MVKRIFFLLLGAFFLLTGLPAWGALDLSEIGVGARPLGMGRAYIGLADDASAVFFNPAGLARGESLSLVSMSGSMFGDAGYLMFGGANSLPIGRVGFGYMNSSIGGIPLTTITGTGSTQAITQYGQTDYSSSQMFFSYGSKLNRFLKNGWGHNLAVGGTLKLFSQGFSGGGVTMQNASGSGMDADFGLLWDAHRSVNIGLVFQNFLPESLGGKFTWQARAGQPAVVEGIPSILRLGSHVRLLGLDGLFKNLEHRFDLTLDCEKENLPDRPLLWHAGAEYSPLELIALRVGIDQKARAESGGYGVDNNLTAGVGFLLSGFTFDYAYHRFGELNENATHFFSIGYRGEEKALQREKIREERKRLPTIPLPEVVAKPELKTFLDVPENYWAQRPIEYLATLGIMNGYSDGTFKPTQEITRGELAALLIKGKGLDPKGEVRKNFSDVTADNALAPYISLAVEKGYLAGYVDGTFQPKRLVTRGEGAIVFAKYNNFYVKPKTQLRPFPDISRDSPVAGAIAANRQAGLYEYLAGKSFGPDLYLTRAEVAEVFSKMPFIKKQIEKLISGSGKELLPQD